MHAANVVSEPVRRECTRSNSSSSSRTRKLGTLSARRNGQNPREHMRRGLTATATTHPCVTCRCHAAMASASGPAEWPTRPNSAQHPVGISFPGPPHSRDELGRDTLHEGGSHRPAVEFALVEGVIRFDGGGDERVLDETLARLFLRQAAHVARRGKDEGD